MTYNTPRQIWVHISASSRGDAREIDIWHKDRGFKWAPTNKAQDYGYPLRHIGYHDVILNGRTYYNSKYDVNLDGVIERGRPYSVQGAHTYLENKNSVGIVFVGKDTISKKQASSLLLRLVQYCIWFDITPSEETLRGHRESDYANGKTCPVIDMVRLRHKVKVVLERSKPYLISL